MGFRSRGLFYNSLSGGSTFDMVGFGAGGFIWGHFTSGGPISLKGDHFHLRGTNFTSGGPIFKFMGRFREINVASFCTYVFRLYSVPFQVLYKSDNKNLLGLGFQISHFLTILAEFSKIFFGGFSLAELPDPLQVSTFASN